MGEGAVAVLGAGMAGAAAARRLVEAGFAVHVFDKGRGPGGRMANRRTEADLRFDHGAQYFRARGDAFRARCDAWVAAGVAAPWGAEARFVGVPTMTAPVRDLLDGVPVSSGTTITGVRRVGARWTVTDAAGTTAPDFDAVAVTFPAPQVAALLDASGLVLPGIERATYAPCWSLMLTLDADPGLPHDLLKPDAGPIALVVREASKPGRAAGHRLVAHAAPAWSRAHLEDPREAVQAALLAALATVLGHPLHPIDATVHRWRYAMVETALGQDCVYDPAQRLGAAGDWCLGPRIEAAFDSGQALAQRIAADLTGAR
ncbi:NAD(P)/FAD-dependent oxidoreductase [uncultured Methylobacterium sp.]|uniref:NAD(P)/FAD-dependent oxidoreductase n=1 Tax=uncultured Methylobacterium sp. TaxID=157278 RepID=UPI0035CC094C